MAWLVPFLVYWFILFVVSYILVEYGHRYLYDEVPKYAPLRVALGSLALAAMLTWTRSAFETMFTADLKWTVLQVILWCIVFVAVYSFHPIHGVGFAIASMVVVAGMSTIAVDTMTKPRPDERTQFQKPREPIRRSSGGSGPLIPPAEDAKTQAEPAKKS